jgi:ferric-dicitrate binding protein FerR (iron transport regulator)
VLRERDAEKRQSAARRRRQRVVTGGVAAAACATFAIWIGARQVSHKSVGPSIAESPIESPMARVRLVTGQVASVRGAERSAAVAGTALGPGDGLETADQASAEVAFLGDSTLVLDAATTIRWESSADGASVVRLGRGALKAAITQRVPPESIAFVTPHARATIVGTRFELSTTPTMTRLTVLEGQVRFERLADGAVSTVSAGRSAEAPARASAQSLAQALPSDGPVGTSTVMSLDFEDGVLPPVVTDGQLVSGPCKPGSKHCLIGTMLPNLTRCWSVKISKYPNALFYYSSRMVLGFDYLVSDEADKLDVDVNVGGNKRLNYLFTTSAIARGAWSRAEIRLSDLQSYPVRMPLDDGDPIRIILICAGRGLGKPVYVDNVKVLEYAPQSFPASSTGKEMNPDE